MYAVFALRSRKQKQKQADSVFHGCHLCHSCHFNQTTWWLWLINQLPRHLSPRKKEAAGKKNKKKKKKEKAEKGTNAPSFDFLADPRAATWHVRVAVGGHRWKVMDPEVPEHWEFQVLVALHGHA